MNQMNEPLTITEDLGNICEEPIDIASLISKVGTNDSGAISSFIGTTRDNFEGKRVLRLEYESYTPMAQKELLKICSKIRNKWDVKKIAMVHRIGLVPIGEASVAIMISSAHRKESLEATSWAIDELKSTVPIWKKEIYEDSSSSWKHNCECSFALEKKNITQNS